ncbi:MAG: spore coat protein [Clostridia bacterium]|nr:spore coat protein [Clostridia bacterium]
MNCNANCGFTDKEQMTDLLMSEKYLAGCYGSYLLESATPEVVSSLRELQSDVYGAQQQLFQDMNSRGWYPVTKAEEQKIGQTKMKFSAMVTQ